MGREHGTENMRIQTNFYRSRSKNIFENIHRHFVPTAILNGEENSPLMTQKLKCCICVK